VCENWHITLQEEHRLRVCENAQTGGQY